MGDDKSDDKAITIRCSKEFKLLMKFASAAEEQNMSDYIRTNMRETAEEDLDSEVVAQAKRVADGEESEESAGEVSAPN